jgi:hypothetical protein
MSASLIVDQPLRRGLKKFPKIFPSYREAVVIGQLHIIMRGFRHVARRHAAS